MPHRRAISIICASLACAGPPMPDAPLPEDASPRDALDASDGPDARDAAIPVCEGTTLPTGLVATDGRLGEDGPAIPIEALCDAVADAVCTAPASCGCATVPDCRARALATCGSAPDAPVGAATRSAVEREQITYDANAAGVVVAAIRDAARACGNQPSSLHLAHTLAAVGALFGGAGDGAACEMAVPFTCRRGSVCRNVGDFVFQCGPSWLASEGTCTAFGLCEAQRSAELRCAGAPCDRGLAGGARCVAGECATGVCVDGVCGCEASTGESCVVSAQCVSGVCQAGACAPAPRLGEACSSLLDCADGWCDSGTCVVRQCASAPWLLP